MYAVISIPFVSRTLATLRNAELGFLGGIVLTCRHTPRRCGDPLVSRLVLPVSELYEYCSAGLLVCLLTLFRPFFTSWLTVGNTFAPFLIV